MRPLDGIRAVLFDLDTRPAGPDARPAPRGGDAHGPVGAPANTSPSSGPARGSATAEATAPASRPDVVLLTEVLDRIGLPWARLDGARPATAASGDPGPASRPGHDPAEYRTAAARLGVEPARCLLVGDDPAVLDAGRRAGLATALSDRDTEVGAASADPARIAWSLSRDGDPRGWWTDAVGYEVYLPSFQDGDGDGWGDLPGVVRRLDHLVDLGVDILWLSPFFASPMRDHGYDIADYRTVDPSFGGDDALDTLVREAHRRGLRVMGDLVVNHTSDAHPWFRAASASADDPHRDHYIWRDPAPGGGPPNNWLSHFGGPAWTLSPRTGQYYLHLFKPEQPDLNWRNPAVAADIDAVMEHWLARGLDGFRIDTAAYLVKHPDLPDNPLLPDGVIAPTSGTTDEWRRQDHRYDIHQPDVHAVHERWRRLADRHNAYLVGEIYELEPLALADYVAEERLHSSFWFGLIDTDWEHRRIRDMVLSAATASSRLSWVQGNHDRRRAASRFGGGETGRRRSLALHVLMAFLPGTFWLYQGEELGLADGEVPPGQGADPLGDAQPDQSRDVARTPMPWSPGPGLGFSTGTPWLPPGARAAADTVAHQARDPRSHLAAVRRLLDARRRLIAGGAASGEAVLPGVPAAPDDLTGYRRGRVAVLANLSDDASEAFTPPAPVVFDTDDPGAGPLTPRYGSVRLAPQQAVILCDLGGRGERGGSGTADAPGGPAGTGDAGPAGGPGGRT